MEVHIRYPNAPQNWKGNCTVLTILISKTAILHQHVETREVPLDPEAVLPPLVEAEAEVEAEGELEAEVELNHRTILQVEGKE